MTTPEPHVIALAWYHGVIALGGLLAVFATVHRLWIAPVQSWRKDVDAKHAAYDVALAEVNKDLDRGRDKFDQVIEECKAIREDMKEHEAKQNERHQKVIERLAAIETTLRERSLIPNQD